MDEIPGEWSFDAKGVAGQFDCHVRESLPWYDLCTTAVADIGRHYVQPGGTVFDIGASTGNIGKALGPTLVSRGASLVAVEPSVEMADLWTPPEGLDDAVKLINKGAEFVEWSTYDIDLAVFFLVLMFVPVIQRRGVLDTVYDRLHPGGAMVVVDKCLPTGGYPGSIMMRLALAGKLSVGVKPEQIVAKELSLAGVQRPIDPRILPGEPVEWFRMGDFAGWLIEKPEA